MTSWTDRSTSSIWRNAKTKVCFTLSITSTCGSSELAEYLASQIGDIRRGQEEATDELAGKILEVGPKKALAIVQQGIRPSAPTPLNFREKEEAYPQSVFVLNRANCECFAVSLKMHAHDGVRPYPRESIRRTCESPSRTNGKRASGSHQKEQDCGGEVRTGRH